MYCTGAAGINRSREILLQLPYAFSTPPPAKLSLLHRLSSAAMDSSSRTLLQSRAQPLVEVAAGRQVVSSLLPRKPAAQTKVEVNGAVVLAKKNVLDVQNKAAGALDLAAELVGLKVDIQLVSELTGQVSDASSIQKWSSEGSVVAAGEASFPITFSLPQGFGRPGAILVRNHHPNEFYLASLSLTFPDLTTLHFSCNSVVYPVSKYPPSGHRVFFSNKAYLPSETPEGVRVLRQEEMQTRRGNGTGEREVWENVYDYATYNDLSQPDDDVTTIRPILGGSALPYPRRIRTGRPASKADPSLESPVGSLLLERNYTPRDEVFSREKLSSVLADAIKAAAHTIVPAIRTFFQTTPDTFKSFAAILDLYDRGIDLDGCIDTVPDDATESQNPFVLLTQFFSADDDNKSLLKYPTPDVVQVDPQAWCTDEEFGRQALAGLNPIVIQLLTEFPPRSSLDPNVYGPATALTSQHIQPFLEGLSVEQAVAGKRLFKVDYHDLWMPYINKQNSEARGKGYAPRTIFFLTSKGTLMPVAIELALPPPSAGKQGSIRVFTPQNAKDKDYLWELAKLHASCVDFGYHELVSHWVQTHAVMEPIIIAVNRQLSAMHPVHILLKPHFSNTMNINAAARQALINAEGIIETCFTPGKYSMEMSAVVYGATWRFDTQALPQDLISRGMAEPADESYPGGVKLVIEDYPFAKDGLELWDAINSWVRDYVQLAYKGSDQAVKADMELQAWWKEIVEVGHGDLKAAKWWPKLDSISSLVHTLATIVWIAGPHHAAVNFGQFAYAGYMPNRPSLTRRLIPEPGSPEHKELLANPEKFLLSSITSPTAATSVMTTIEILSTHAENEEYLGERNDPYWTSDADVLAAFNKFGQRLKALETNIIQRNHDKALRNRKGPANLPYNLLFPSSPNGLTGQGVPNSTSI